jgi:hypothetical protein
MVAAGTGETLPGPMACGAWCCRSAASYNQRPSGSGRPAGRESEAAVLPLEPTGQHNPRRGKGRCFVHAFMHREGQVSATRG